MKQVLNISESQKNIGLIAVGLILLFYALGIFSCTLRVLIILIGAATFALGFMRSGYSHKAMGYIKKTGLLKK